MNTEPFNLFEHIVRTEINRAGATAVAARIEVSRRSLSTEVLSRRLSGFSDEPRFPIHRLLLASSDEGTDLEPFFALDARANHLEREVIALLAARYAEPTLPLSSRCQAVFTFSMPVPADGAQVLYYAVNFGFLAGHDALCRFEGSFESPAALEYRLLGQS